MDRQIHAVAIAISLFFSFESTILAAPLYHVTDLGVLSGSLGSVAYGVNNHGWVVGKAYGVTDSTNERAFLFKDGTMTDLGNLGGTLNGIDHTVATSINDAGQITGYSFTSAGEERAFIYTNGTMLNLGVPTGYVTSAGIHINNLGQVVGSTSPDFGTSHAMLYDGSMHDLGTLPMEPDRQSYANAKEINDLGIIVGNSNEGIGAQVGFVYDGTMHSLGALGTANTSDARGINNLGQIVGGSELELLGGVQHAFLYENGVMTDLGGLGSRNFTDASAINEVGQIVGMAYTSAGSVSGHAFLVDHGVMLDVNNLLDASSSHWTLIYAYDINDNGWIVGYGNNPAGDTHAYLAIPVPEPSSFFLACGFMALILLWKATIVRNLSHRTR